MLKPLTFPSLFPALCPSQDVRYCTDSCAKDNHALIETTTSNHMQNLESNWKYMLQVVVQTICSKCLSILNNYISFLSLHIFLLPCVVSYKYSYANHHQNLCCGFTVIYCYMPYIIKKEVCFLAVAINQIHVSFVRELQVTMHKPKQDISQYCMSTTHFQWMSSLNYPTG